MAKGKYAEVIANLPKLKYFGAESADKSYQMKVNDVKRQLPSMTSAEVTKAWAKLRAEKRDIEEELKELNLKLEAFAQILTETYEAEGVTKIELEDGSNVSVSAEPHSTVEDPEAFRVWCIQQGLEKELRLHSKTADSLVKERLLAGLPEPPGVKVWVRNKISLRS